MRGNAGQTSGPMRVLETRTVLRGQADGRKYHGDGDCGDIDKVFTQRYHSKSIAHLCGVRRQVRVLLNHTAKSTKENVLDLHTSSQQFTQAFWEDHGYNPRQ